MRHFKQIEFVVVGVAILATTGLVIAGAQNASSQSLQPGINVIAGTYGGNCGQPRGNVTADLAAACNGRATCAYTVDHNVIGDPAYGCAKDYVAEWACSGSGGGTVSAPAEAGYGSQVTLACSGGGEMGGNTDNGSGGMGANTGQTMQPFQVAVNCDPDPLVVVISALPSRPCTVWIGGWIHNTASPVQLILPDATDIYGNHANGIQVFGGYLPGSQQGIDPANMGGYQSPDGNYGEWFPWNILVFACPSQSTTGANCFSNAASPGPFNVPMIVHQDGMQDTQVMLSGQAVFAQGAGTGTQGDVLGSVWSEQEVDGWRGTWTRTPGTNDFTANFIHPDGLQIGGSLRMVVSGYSVHIYRWNPGTWGTCGYDGTFAADFRSVSGTYSCTLQNGQSTPTYTWSATIQ
jgi:hypothetical protein